MVLVIAYVAIIVLKDVNLRCFIIDTDHLEADSLTEYSCLLGYPGESLLHELRTNFQGGITTKQYATTGRLPLMVLDTDKIGLGGSHNWVSLSAHDGNSVIIIFIYLIFAILNTGYCSFN